MSRRAAPPVGARIADARTDAGLSQRQLAQKLAKMPGTPDWETVRGYINKYENNKLAPDDVWLKRIARATNKPLSYFTDGLPPSPEEMLLEAARRLERASVRLERMIAERS